MAPRLALVTGLSLILLTAAVTETRAQAPAETPGAAGPIPVVDGPPPPTLPETVARDAEGRTTVRAVRLQEPLRLDGTLDEPIYEQIHPMSGFTQIEPRPGETAKEQTDVWLFFDGQNIYVSARAWDSDPASIVATELRRDNNTIFNGNDIVAFALDTFYDRRNSILLTVNPAGGRQDGQVTNERQYNGDWNPIWSVKTGRFDRGWTLEAAIPFKSIRYRGGTGQLWGFNVLRVKRSTTEISFLRAVPPARGQQAINQNSLAATVVGLDAPLAGRPLDLKPYVTSRVTSDLRATPQVRNDVGKDAGLDLKYALTQGVTADLTVRTDFAQVEADEQQVNLTRFSLFFPEKRDFFLENQGIFSFGGIANSGNTAGTTDAPILFYSRRIGLNNGSVVPLRAGGRVTGQVGPWSLGVIDIGTGDDATATRAALTPATNFSVVRLRRNVLRRGTLGFIGTGRSVGQNGGGGNVAYGVDGVFPFFQSLLINTYWARTDSPGRRGDDTSYRGQLDYNADRYGVTLERIGVGADFNPEAGFVRRGAMTRSSALARFSPRLTGSTRIRKLSYTVSTSFTDGSTDGRLESREHAGEFGIDFLNGDKLLVGYSDVYELLRRPFRLNGVTFAPGGYDFDNLKVNYNMAQQHPVGANITAERGRFYDGTKTSLSIARGRVRMSRQLSVEPTWSVNHVTSDHGRFTTQLAGARVTYTMTPLMFTSALMQYSTSAGTVSVNARLRWEYQPGSELFVVYNEERDTLAPRFPSAMNRAFIVKVNRLFRY